LPNPREAEATVQLMVIQQLPQHDPPMPPASATSTLTGSSKPVTDEIRYQGSYASSSSQRYGSN